MISGDLLREARRRAGLTQIQLGRRLGLSQSAIARWERGDVKPSLETLRELIRACGLELIFQIEPLDTSNLVLLDEGLALDPAQRFERGVRLTRFYQALLGRAEQEAPDG